MDCGCLAGEQNEGPAQVIREPLTRINVSNPQEDGSAAGAAAQSSSSSSSEVVVMAAEAAAEAE